MTFLNFIKRFSGLFLLLLGLVVICYALFSSFSIFTAKSTAPEIFKLEDKAQAVSGVQEQIQEMISQQLKGMIPVDSIATLLNLISWSIFAGILIFGGAQIANLGIKLIK